MCQTLEQKFRLMGCVYRLNPLGELFARLNEPMHTLEMKLPTGENLCLPHLGGPTELGWTADREISGLS